MPKTVSSILRQVPLFKLTSLGNDVLIFLFPCDGEDTSAWDAVRAYGERGEPMPEAALLADRHFGVGADGVIFVGAGHESIDSYFFNADGSPGQLCLNGARALGVLFALLEPWLARQGEPIPLRMGGTAVDVLVSEIFNARAGTRSSKERATSGGLSAVDTIRGTLFDGGYGWSHIALGTVIAEKVSITIESTSFTGSFVDVGNPHFIVDTFRSVAERDAALLTYGAALCAHSQFPAGANISFVVAGNNGSYNVRTYERGCGLTLACSSALCAHATLLCHTNPTRCTGGDMSIPYTVLGGDARVHIVEGIRVMIGACVYLTYSGSLGWTGD